MAERRKQIIERAAGVIYRQGFGATTIADILNAAGVGKGNFYHYFEGKEDFGLAIIDGLGHEVGGVELDEIFSPHKPPLRRLADYLDIVSKSRLRDESGDPLCTLASELGATPPYAGRLKAAFTGLVDRFEALVAEFALEMRAPIDAGRMARIVLAQIHGVCVQFKVDHDATAFGAGIAAVPMLLEGAVTSSMNGSSATPANRAQAAG
jgi:TetR/AcrR family transcriptional regulator, transcriptional repressor for nem operon